MSNLNSANTNSVGSANVSIAKAEQNLLFSRYETSKYVRDSMFSALGQSATQAFGGIPSPSGCRLSRDCAEGWACIDGTCTDMSGPGSDRITTPGDCELPDDGLETNPCGKDGGCAQPTCGETVGEGGLDCCGGTIYRGFVASRGPVNPTTGERSTIETWKEQCEPLEHECDQYADSWYKSTGELPRGYEVEQLCSSCSECGSGLLCTPISDSFAPCYCNPEKCKDKEGPCFDCDFESGDCLETCEGCVAECNQFFTCPCDKSQTRYEAKGSFNPCTSASGGCWEPTAEKIREFCAETFPCEDENQCKGDCETLKSTSGYPDCPSGKLCQQNGFIQNADTGATTYFVTACGTKSDCGCAAPPNSPLYQACGECEICENGSCVQDPACGQIFVDYDGRYYDPKGWHYDRVDWVCAYCDPNVPYEGQCNAGSSHIDYQGGGVLTNCKPSDPFCKYTEEWNNGQHNLLNEPLYSDGIFTMSVNGEGVWYGTCGAESDSTVQTQIGSYTYQRLVDVLDDYSMTVLYKRLLVTMTRGYFVTTGSYASGRRGQPVKVTQYRELVSVRTSSTGRPVARIKYPVSTWESDVSSMDGFQSYTVVAENDNFEEPERPTFP